MLLQSLVSRLVTLTYLIFKVFVIDLCVVVAIIGAFASMDNGLGLVNTVVGVVGVR